MTTTEYVSAALDAMIVTGIRVAFWGWLRLEPQLRHTIGVLTHHTARRHLLERSSWAAAASLYAFLTEHADSLDLRELARVHGWHARKQTQGLDAIRDEVEAWTVPTPDFALARACLLDRRDLAVAHARSLVATGALTRMDVRASPVLEWIVPLLDAADAEHR